MEIKIDASEYNKLIVENDRLKKELERINHSYSRTSDALKRVRKEEKELLYKIAELVFTHKEDNREAVMGLRLLMVESGLYATVCEAKSVQIKFYTADRLPCFGCQMFKK